METFLNILRPLPPVCPDLVRPQVSVRFFNLPPLKEAAREEDLQKDSGVRESKTKKNRRNLRRKRKERISIFGRWFDFHQLIRHHPIVSPVVSSNPKDNLFQVQQVGLF